jgi:hypothetical protein
MKWILFSALVLKLATAQAQLSLGDRFELTTIEGQLTVYCGGATKTVTCRDVFMDPWPYDVFKGPRNRRATQVQLRSMVGTSSEVAIVDYDGPSGISSEINLGIRSLFQRPLLRLGQNQVTWILADRNNSALATDQFSVSVTRGTSRRCPDREVSATTQTDCDFPYSLCQAYFRGEKYCR